MLRPYWAKKHSMNREKTLQNNSSAADLKKITIKTNAPEALISFILKRQDAYRKGISQFNETVRQKLAQLFRRKEIPHEINKNELYAFMLEESFSLDAQATLMDFLKKNQSRNNTINIRKLHLFARHWLNQEVHLALERQDNTDNRPKPIPSSGRIRTLLALKNERQTNPILEPLTLDDVKLNYQALATCSTPESAFATYMLGIIEAKYGSYIKALQYFKQTKANIHFHTLDQLLQKITQFGIVLSELKSNDTLAPKYWDDIFPLRIQIAKDSQQSGSKVTLFLIGNPLAEFMPIIRPFLRHNEFTQNLTPLFEQLNPSLLAYLSDPAFDWSLILTEQLNELIQITPTERTSGLIALFNNDYGIYLLCNQKKLRDKITTEGLDAVSMKGYTALFGLFSYPQTLTILMNDAELCNKISKQGLNATYHDGTSPLGLLALSPQGTVLLETNSGLRDKISLEGLINAINYVSQKNIKSALTWLNAEQHRLLTTNKTTLTQTQLKKLHRTLKKADEEAAHSNYAAALEGYHQALIIHPTDVSTIRKRGEIYIKLGDYKNACEQFDQVITTLPLSERMIISTLFLNAGQLDIAYRYCINVLNIDPNCLNALEQLQRLGQEGMLNENLTITKASYRTLSQYNNRLGLKAKFNMGLIEALYGDYEEALSYYQSIKKMDIQWLDRLTQNRINFGIALFTRKLNMPHSDAVFRELESQNKALWGALHPHLLSILISDQIKVFILGSPNQALVEIIEPFYRENEFTQNCILLFEHFNPALSSAHSGLTLGWQKLLPSQLNAIIKYTPTHHQSGLMAMVNNPFAMILLSKTDHLKAIISEKGLNSIMPCDDGKTRSPLTRILTYPFGLKFIITTPQLCEKITSDSLNTVKTTDSIFVLGLLVTKEEGIAFLCGTTSKTLKNKISTTGLDTSFHSDKGKLSVLCHMFYNERLIALLQSDLDLCNKISEQGFNTEYTLHDKSISPLLLSASTIQGQALLDHNEQLRHKITKEGLIKAMSYAKRDNNELALNWLKNESKNDRYTTLSTSMFFVSKNISTESQSSSELNEALIAPPY